MGVLSEHATQEIRALPARYPEIRSAVMPALDIAQEDKGFLTPEAMSEVAGLLMLDPGYVEGVATFYSLFHLQPVGQHRFYVCTNLSCQLRGADELVSHLREKVGVRSQDDVSADGLFSVEEVECLGACEYAPMMRLDHRYHYDLTPEILDGLVAERQGGKARRPLEGPAAGGQGGKARRPLEGAAAGGEDAPLSQSGPSMPTTPAESTPRKPRRQTRSKRPAKREAGGA